MLKQAYNARYQAGVAKVASGDWKDELPGGKGDRAKPSDFPKKSLKAGEKVEREHTTNKHIQEEIALDHLTEDRNYYKKLKKVEGDE